MAAGHRIATPLLHPAIDQSPKVATALRMGQFASGRQPFSEADVWLLSGTNPLASHFGGWGANTMYAPAASLRTALDRGMRLIIVDPRRTETACLATLHLQVKPGQDVAEFAGMLHFILSRGMHDRDFCERHVSHLGALAAADMAPHANLAEHLLECLNAVRGRYRRAGEPVLNVSALARAVMREQAQPPFPLWDHSPRMASHPEVGYQIPDEFPTNLLADEILHHGPDRIRAGSSMPAIRRWPFRGTGG